MLLGVGGCRVRLVSLSLVWVLFWCMMIGMDVFIRVWMMMLIFFGLCLVVFLMLLVLLVLVMWLNCRWDWYFLLDRLLGLCSRMCMICELLGGMVIWCGE